MSLSHEIFFVMIVCKQENFPPHAFPYLSDSLSTVPLGSGLKMRDSLWDGLTDQHVGTPMGITAENLAEQYDISREVRPYYA